MQFNTAFCGPGLPNYGQFYPSNSPLQCNRPSYPEVIGEGEVTSLMFPDGSIQFYFMPTSKWCSQFTYPPNNPNCNSPHWNNNNVGVWFVRSIANPVPCFSFNQLQQQLNQIQCAAPSPTSNPGLQFKFHNDCWTSTTDLKYFCPRFRPFNITQSECAGVQVSMPMETSIERIYEVTNDKKQCKCGRRKSCKADSSQSSMSIEDTRSQRKRRKYKRGKRHCRACHSSSDEKSESRSSIETKTNKKKKNHGCKYCCSVERRGNKKDGASPSSHTHASETEYSTCSSCKRKDRKHKKEIKTKNKNRASQSSFTSETSACSCSGCKTSKKDKNEKEEKKNQASQDYPTSENPGCSTSKQIKPCRITINEPDSKEYAGKANSLSFGDSKQKFTPHVAAKPICSTLNNDSTKIEEKGIKCAHINEICGCPISPDTSHTYGSKCAHIAELCECPETLYKMATDSDQIISPGGNGSQISYQSVPMTGISNPLTESKMETWFSKTQLDTYKL